MVVHILGEHFSSYELEVPLTTFAVSFMWIVWPPIILGYSFPQVLWSFVIIFSLMKSIMRGNCCCSVTKPCLTLQFHGLQDTRLSSPSLSPRICSDSCLLSWWCYLTISSSAALFFCLQSSSHRGLFQWVGSSYHMTKVLELQLQHQSFQWIVRVNFLQDWLVWSLCCSRDSQESSLPQQFEGIVLRCSAFFMVQLSHPSIYDYWIHHSFDYTGLCWQSDVSAF